MMRSAALGVGVFAVLGLAACNQQPTTPAAPKAAEATRIIERDTNTVVRSAGNQMRDTSEQVANGTRRAATDVQADIRAAPPNVTVNPPPNVTVNVPTPAGPPRTTTTRRTTYGPNGVTTETTQTTPPQG